MEQRCSAGTVVQGFGEAAWKVDLCMWIAGSKLGKHILCRGQELDMLRVMPNDPNSHLLWMGRKQVPFRGVVALANLALETTLLHPVAHH